MHKSTSHPTIDYLTPRTRGGTIVLLTKTQWFEEALA